MQDVRRVLSKATESTETRTRSGTIKRYLEDTKEILENISKKMEPVVAGLEKEINDSVQISINLVGLPMSQLTAAGLTGTTDQSTNRTAQGRHRKGQRVQEAPVQELSALPQSRQVDGRAQVWRD